jgi:hypothetical protein
VRTSIYPRRSLADHGIGETPVRDGKALALIRGVVRILAVIAEVIDVLKDLLDLCGALTKPL